MRNNLIAGRELKCKCGKVWQYKGQQKVVATCPDCRCAVRLQKQK